MMLPMWLFGQSYSELWKKANEAEDKDLPKTQYEVLQKIVAKAEKEKAYGQLLKAELNAAQVMSVIAPDSLKPAVEQIQKRGEATKDEVLESISIGCMIAMNRAQSYALRRYAEVFGVKLDSSYLNGRKDVKKDRSTDD